VVLASQSEIGWMVLATEIQIFALAGLYLYNWWNKGEGGDSRLRKDLDFTMSALGALVKELHPEINRPKPPPPPPTPEEIAARLAVREKKNGKKNRRQPLR
jgi:hypothetical protein